LSARAHTPDTLAAGLARRFPDVTPADVEEAIGGLDGLGMVEDAGVSDPSDPGRYFTNLVFFQSFATLSHTRQEMQRRLIDAHVLVLGVGGLGSTVLMHLVGAGVGR